MTQPPDDYIRRNRDRWDDASESYQQKHVDQLGVSEPTWGVWSISERELQAIGDVSGLELLELGCGGGQWSVALSRWGARCTGVDLSARQLRHARDLAARERVPVRFVLANAQMLPLKSETFDLVFCDHGAMTFSDPYLTVPQVERVLRPGGRFIFNAATPFLEICWDPSLRHTADRLRGTYFGLHRIDEDEMTSFQLPYGEWIRLFRKHGFIVEDLVELRPPEGATTTFDEFTTLEWARRWPAEQIWKVRKGG